MRMDGITLGDKPDNEKDFLALLIDYGKASANVQPPTTTPPTTPPAPVPRLVLTEREKYGEALYQSGGFAAVLEYFAALKRFADSFLPPKQ